MPAAAGGRRDGTSSLFSLSRRGYTCDLRLLFGNIREKREQSKKYTKEGQFGGGLMFRRGGGGRPLDGPKGR